VKTNSGFDVSIVLMILSKKLTKSWFRPSKEVVVMFIGEASVDTGRPRREFFTCE